MYASETKVVDLGDALGGDEDVGGFEVAVDDRRRAGVEVLEPLGNAEHDLEHGEEGRMLDRTDIVEQVTVRAQLGADHHGDAGRLLGDRDADEMHDVGVSQVAE